MRFIDHFSKREQETFFPSMEDRKRDVGESFKRVPLALIDFLMNKRSDLRMLSIEKEIYDYYFDDERHMPEVSPAQFAYLFSECGSTTSTIN
jgi:hypothetical protein